MTCRSFLLAILAILAVSAPLVPQGRLPLRGTFDDRLSALEERLAAVEDRLAREDEERLNALGTRSDRLSLESEAKLDRLEVRVIQLETTPPNCDCDSIGQRSLVERIRSLERQVSRIRASAIR